MAIAASYGSLPFEQQINYMQRKRPSIDYATVSRDAHNTAFVVAGANRTDLIADIHQVLLRSMRDGSTLERFREDFYAVLDHYGWEPEGGREWRSRVIYETNLRASYAAGRYSQLMELREVRPYWMYNHSDAVITPREQHEAWNRLVLLWNDPWWNTHYTPNGWGCQCYITAHNLRDLKRMGKTGADTAPADEMVRVFYKGEWQDVPKGIDAGWNYAPGRSQYAQQIQTSLEKTTRLPAEPAAAINQQLLSNQAVASGLQTDLNQFIQAVSNNQPMSNNQLFIGTIEPAIIEPLKQQSKILQTATIAISDNTLGQILRQPTIDAALASQLPTVLSSPQAVLFNNHSNTLRYVYDYSETTRLVADVTINLLVDPFATKLSNPLQQLKLINIESNPLYNLGYRVIKGSLRG